MQSSNNIAFKEWAAVCAAITAGRQTIILRKGGIDEGREGFRVEHNEFWLLPTRFHQDASALVSDAQPYSDQSLASQPDGGFRIDLYAVVQQVFEVHDLAALEHLSDHHILSLETITQRFHYRRPGLFVLAIRAYRLPQPFDVADSPYIAGCKSWVELPEPHATSGVAPVLDDATFAQRLQSIQQIMILK